MPDRAEMLRGVFDGAAGGEGRREGSKDHLGPGLVVVDVHGLDVGSQGQI